MVIEIGVCMCVRFELEKLQRNYREKIETHVIGFLRMKTGGPIIFWEGALVITHTHTHVHSSINVLA